jgi:hypothetical protein
MEPGVASGEAVGRGAVMADPVTMADAVGGGEAGFGRRRGLLPLVLWSGGLLLLTNSTAPAAATHLRCTNPASGASWELVVDHDRRLVDSYPASIGEKWISWFDPTDRGYFDLERTTGELQVRHASSTGGYYLFDKCEPL